MDAAELFASSRVSIAPLFQGGGVRIKIPESLILGCPVVATTIGAEGHDLPGITRTDDPAAFADACSTHLSQAATPASTDALRAGVAARYEASIVGRRLVTLWSELAGAARLRDAASAPARGAHRPS
jgi:glycosyltransferase involved in cell wall biosynthesis